MTHPLDELNYDWLTSAEEILKAQRKAEQEVSGFTSDEYQYIRNKSKNDLFFLNHFLLGYTRLLPMLHGHLSS